MIYATPVNWETCSIARHGILHAQDGNLIDAGALNISVQIRLNLVVGMPFAGVGTFVDRFKRQFGFHII